MVPFIPDPDPDNTVGKYILDADGEPVPCYDLFAWARWLETAPRHVGNDVLYGDSELQVRVSTVFLGLDHNYFGGGPPILWETMVFIHHDSVGRGESWDEYTRRYSSRQEALAGHNDTCLAVMQAMDLTREPKGNS